MATASSTSKLYKMVVEDVINNVKEAFLDEGVDEQVLQELKQLWETKLTASKALEPAQNESEVVIQSGAAPQLTVFQPQQQVISGGQVQQTFPGLPVQINRAGTELSGGAAAATMALPRGIFQQQMAALNAPAITLANGQLIAVPQLTQQRGQAPTSITIPQHATVLPGQLPQGITMQQIRQATTVGQVRTVNPNMVQPQQLHGMRQVSTNQTSQNPVIQLDGTGDTSSSDDDDFNDDDDDENENENENEEEAQGEEEEPLNTDDDISEEDPNDLFDTDNVVVCQYDKINRNKNKWKFHLKDGIMNLKGKDYVFQKANGDSEW